jgi:hypothetical protein
LLGDDERGRLAVEPLLLTTKRIHFDVLPHRDSTKPYIVEEITLTTVQMQVVRQLVFKYPKVAYDVIISAHQTHLSWSLGYAGNDCTDLHASPARVLRRYRCRGHELAGGIWSSECDQTVRPKEAVRSPKYSVMSVRVLCHGR